MLALWAERVHIDFEGQSAADIGDVGACLYSEHPTTRPTALTFCVDRDAPETLTYEWFNEGAPLHPRLYALAANPNVLLYAHNAIFENKFWNDHMVKLGYPPIPTERWRCTMAKALRHSLSGSLEDAANMLNLDYRKDTGVGKASMRLTAKPKCYWCECGKFFTDLKKPCCAGADSTPEFYTPATAKKYFDQMYDYNAVDVIVERELDDELADLSEDEQEVWFIDQHMNLEGVLLDIPAIRRALHFIDRWRGAFPQEFYARIGLKPTQRQKLKELLATKYGFAIRNTQAETLQPLLDYAEIHDDVRYILQGIIDTNKTSLAKYAEMIRRSDVNGLTRELLRYYGAHTGRWSGQGIQLHNMPRPDWSTDFIVRCMMNFSYETFAFIFGGDVTKALSHALRGMIIPPPGQRVLVADFMQIEARVLAWLSGQQDVLDLFASGEDLYCRNASILYGRPITKKDKKERTVGKVMDLASGYQGGIAGYDNFGRKYGVDWRVVKSTVMSKATDKELDLADVDYRMYTKNNSYPVPRDVGIVMDIVKQRWRESNPKTVQLWGDIENGAIRAVHSKKPVPVGKITWFTHGKFLYCRLPSGRSIAYLYPKVAEGKRGKLTLSYISARYGRTSTYGGSLVENIVQAISRDLLKDAIKRVSKTRLRVRLSVHDENIGFGYAEDLPEFIARMKELPQEWAQGIPIGVEGWEGPRYGKE